MRTFILNIFVCSLVFLNGCKNTSDWKDVAIIQQRGHIEDEWYDVIAVYGYIDNFKNAEIIAEHLKQTNVNPIKGKLLEYRISIRKMDINSLKN